MWSPQMFHERTERAILFTEDSSLSLLGMLNFYYLRASSGIFPRLSKIQFPKSRAGGPSGVPVLNTTNQQLNPLDSSFRRLKVEEKTNMGFFSGKKCVVLISPG